MPTPRLTKEQKELNKNIKARCPKCKSFTYYDFKNSKLASELLALFTEIQNDIDNESTAQ